MTTPHIPKESAGQPSELREALEEARNGLLWYRDRYPEAVDGSDDEAMARIDAALAGPREQLMSSEEAMREALTEISELEPFTATPAQFYKHLQRIASRALAAQPAATVAQPSAETVAWKLVPIEPTETMIDQGHDAIKEVHERGCGQWGECGGNSWSESSAAWKAMLAAAPAMAGEPRNSAGETPTEHAHRWATELAVNLHKKFYPEVTQWNPLPDLLGVITQIDNMTCGLVRGEPTEPSATPRRGETTEYQDALSECRFVAGINVGWDFGVSGDLSARDALIERVQAAYLPVLRAGPSEQPSEP
jgi:hypothetical protein